MTDNSVSHRELYKQIGSTGTLLSLRQSVSFSVRQEQNRQRQDLICQRRFKVKTAHFGEELGRSESEEEELVKSNVRLLKVGHRTQALASLSNAFARLAKNADVFLRCDGFQSLLSCFGSSNVEVLQAAAWCTVNLTAAVSSSQSVMAVASTLAQFLHSSDPLMQELCAWAIGNLAGDSPANVLVLQTQGCVHALMELVYSKPEVWCQPLGESVWFALTNMATHSFQCVEDMQESQIFELVERMFKTIEAQSSLTYHLAWLVNSIYSREETYARYSGQYPSVCQLVSQRLSELLPLETKKDHERLVLPFLHCFANMMGMDTHLSKMAVETHPSTLSWFTDLLTSTSDIIVKETLRALVNCSGNVCSRVLMSFHPKLCPALLSLCHHTNARLALQALTVIDGMTRTSGFVDCHLVGQGVMTKLAPLLQSGDGNPPAVREAALTVVKNLLSTCPQAEEQLKNLHLPVE